MSIANTAIFERAVNFTGSLALLAGLIFDPAMCAN